MLVTSDQGTAIEAALRARGCAVDRVTTCRAADAALDGADAAVIIAAGFDADEVSELVGRALLTATVLVVTEDIPLAVKAARQGASTVSSGSSELLAAHLGQLLALVDLKRRATKDDARDGLEPLVTAAASLLPMHSFQRVYVDYALKRFGGNKVHTAAALGIDRRTIQRWARARDGATGPTPEV